MEAKHSQPTGGERSGGPEQSLTEPPLGGRLPQSPSVQHQRVFPSRSHHTPHGRHHHRQPKRSSLERHYHRLQQQQSSTFQLAGKAETEPSAAGPVNRAVWQFTEAPGPSGGSYPSSSTSSSSALHPQIVPPHSSKEAQEGVPRRERKPQKPGKYVCQYCGRPCAKPSVLQKHIRSHTGERPYPCVPCGFSFKTKSNLYKHRKSHAHRIKAGLATGREGYALSGPESGQPGEEQEEPTEGETTDSEEETGQHMSSSSLDTYGRLPSQKSSSVELSAAEEAQRSEDSQAIKQRLAMRLSERKRAPVVVSDDPPSFLSPGSKGSTESGYFSRSESAEQQQVSPPNANAKSYAEIILGKYGRLGQQQRITPQQQQQQPSSSSASEEKGVPFTVPKTQVIEHITKLITINEAVVDTSEIDSVKPRRTSLSRRSSIESPKVSALKEPFLFDTKAELPSSGTSGSMSVGFQGETLHPQFPDVDLLAGQASTVPLLRSHSMPSSAGPGETAGSSSCGIRLSHSFDERQASAAEVRAGALLPPHQRMLKRQPAIEMPLGTEFIPEEAPSSSASSAMVSDPSRKLRRGPRPYECEACGTRYKKRESYETHRRTYCPARLPQETERETGTSAYRVDRPQMMHYKFGATAAAVRKRRKEKSLGDEEEPPVFESSPAPAATSFSPSSTCIPRREENRPAAETVSREGPLSTSSQTEQDRRTTWKEISVIQHTSSFEKQDVPVESQENEEKIVIPPPREEHQQQTQQQPSKPPSFSKLVRQSNIQVPEILVTEEPDPDVVLASPPATATTKEPEKVEEFQWPQRSQSLAQLPAEKLPPKKKRLRLAEAAQSSGESSFESISLPRSPSQESSLSHTSSRSASFEESGKPDIETQPASTRTSQVTHMLTVPSGHHQHHQPHREMRRSASEQAPTSAQHPAQIAEVRSKSFDYGCLSPQCSSAAWRERRKCLLVRQATLGEPEPEDQPPGRPTKATPQVCLSYHSPAAPPVEPSTASSTSVPEPMSKSLQLFQPPLPLSRDLQPVFPLHPPAPVAITQGQIPQLYPTAGISEVLSAQIGPHSFLQTAPQLRPGQLHIAERLGLPVQQYPPLLPLQYPTGAAQALYLPVPSGLALQMPPEPFRESKPSPSSQGPGPQHPRPVIAPSLEQLRPVVSLVVPVRIQTHVPTYASAMYTTLSQILVTRAQESARSAVVLCKLEEEKLQNPYLKIPTPDFKSYLPMTLPLESVAGMGSEDVLGPSPAGGNKRMLSPAGSLELSAEAQRQQKRVKEEEEEEEEGEGRQEKVRAEAAMEREREDKKKAEKTEETKEEQKAALGKGDQFKEEEREESQVNIPRVRSPDSRKGPSFPSLHTTTSVSWCYLNYIKPNPSTLRDPQTSVYSSWCISVHNPNLPGLSTKTTLSLLRSKQKHSTETYTMATTHRPTSGKLVPANSRKPRMAEIHAAPVSISAEVKETAKPEKEEEKRSKREEEASTSKRSEPSRIRIFEGGYKSNEEYVYVRGRGRGKYVCEECGIRCKKPSMLKKHIRTHTDVRPYVCKYCNFAFKTKGNLTKHMKSKAHGKKCQEMGVSGSSLDELEAEEGGGSEERAGGSEDQEEHQFSDVDDSEDDDENEEEEEEEESSSHEDPPSSCSPDTRHSTGGRSDSGQQPQHDAQESTLPPAQEKEPVARQKDYPSPRRHWPTAREASPGSRRALFSRRRWEASPRAFSPSSEGSPLRCLSPGQGLSPVRPVSPGREVSPLRCLSPRLEVSSPSRHLSPSPERGPSPIRPRSPSRYLAPRTLPTPAPTEIPTSFQRAHSSTPLPAGQAPRDTPSTEASQSRLEKIYFPREGLSSPECYSFPPAPRLPHSASDFPGHAPGRPGDHVFSHLPLHSQQLSRTPYLMIPIGGIQMVQPRPSSHASLAQGPAAALSSPRGTAGGAGRPAGTREAAPGGSPGPSTDAPVAERAPGERRAPEDDRVQESAAGTSLSGLCTGRQGTASASQAPQEDVSQAGGDEPPDAGTKQYGSSRTYSPTSTLAAATAAQTADRGPGVPPASQPASSTPRTPQLSGEEGPPAGRHRRRGPELAGGSTAGSAQNKDGKPGST